MSSITTILCEVFSTEKKTQTFNHKIIWILIYLLTKTSCLINRFFVPQLNRTPVSWESGMIYKNLWFTFQHHCIVRAAVINNTVIKTTPWPISFKNSWALCYICLNLTLLRLLGCSSSKMKTQEMFYASLNSLLMKSFLSVKWRRFQELSSVSIKGLVVWDEDSGNGQMCRERKEKTSAQEGEVIIELYSTFFLSHPPDRAICGELGCPCNADVLHHMHTSAHTFVCLWWLLSLVLNSHCVRHSCDWTRLRWLTGSPRI